MNTFHIPVGQPNPVAQREQMIITWTLLDRSYTRAWVRQHMAVEEHAHDELFRADLTHDYHLMIVLGRAMENLEQSLQLLGWYPPMRRNIHDVLPRRR